jgi:hypothetical protein
MEDERVHCLSQDCDKTFGKKKNFYKHVRAFHSSDIVDKSGEEIMEMLECRMEAKYSVLICIRCKHAVDPTSLARHFELEHDTIVSDEDITTLIKAFEPISNVEFYRNEPGVIDAVEGIEVHHQALYCIQDDCSSAYSTVASLHKHCYTKHTTRRAETDFVYGPAQQVFGTAKQFTRVRLPESGAEKQKRLDGFMKSLAAASEFSFEDLHAANLTPFLREFKLADYIGKLGMSAKEYAKIAHVPVAELSPAQTCLLQAIERMMEKTQKDLKNASPYVKRLLRSTSYVWFELFKNMI